MRSAASVFLDGLTQQASSPLDARDSEYIPPHGTALDRTAFRDRAEGTSVEVTGLDRRGSTRTYVLRPAPAGGLYTATDHPGESIALETVGELHLTEVADAQEWYDFILREDARGRAERRIDPHWGGEDLDRQLLRVEHDVVAYSSEVLSPRALTLDEFRDRLRHELRTIHIAQPKVAPAELPVGLDMSDAFLLRRVTIDLDGPALEYRAKPWLAEADDDSSIRAWVYGSDEGDTLHPGLHLRAGDGTVHHGLLTDVLEASEVEAALARAAGEPDSPWWVIVEPTTGMGLLVSREHHLVTVETDHDGATVRIDVEPRRQAVNRLRDRDRFERQWGAWLDPRKGAERRPDRARHRPRRAAGRDAPHRRTDHPGS